MLEGSRIMPVVSVLSNDLDTGGRVITKAFADTLSGSPRITEAVKDSKRDPFHPSDRVPGQTNGEATESAVTRAGAEFLAKNKNQPGVITLTNGLQYKILKAGTGETPKADDTVSVTYRGTHVDGAEFDSGTHEFQANRVIPGWTQALQLMPVGSKWQLFIPSDLAYGPRGHAPSIGPDEMLIFDVELLSTKAAAPTAPAQMTSDIIKVPSAEGLKHGEKIETIKASDVGKMVTKTNN